MISFSHIFSHSILEWLVLVISHKLVSWISHSITMSVYNFSTFYLYISRIFPVLRILCPYFSHVLRHRPSAADQPVRALRRCVGGPGGLIPIKTYCHYRRTFLFYFLGLTHTQIYTYIYILYIYSIYILYIYTYTYYIYMIIYDYLCICVL